MAWSEKNRSPLIRIPAARGNSTRVELRSVDPSANPYLALATILSAGLKGIREELEAPAPVDCNIYSMTARERLDQGITSLPGSLQEAIHELKASDPILDALGPHISTSFIKAKTKEYEEYAKYVSPWEIEQYFTNY